MKKLGIEYKCMDIKDIFESMPVAMALMDREGRYVVVNKALSMFGGLKSSDLIGKKAEEISKESGENIKRDFQYFDEGREVPDHELQIGERKYLVSVKPVRNESGYAIGDMVALTDITRIKEIEHELAEANKRLEYFASQDPLTGVLNTRTFYEVCDQIINIAQRDDKTFSLLFIDIDHFKKVNDTYGHAAGDCVLKSITKCIRESIRSSDIIGRVGGEEFSVFLPETDHVGSMQLAEKVRLIIEKEATVFNDTELKVTVSIGVSSRMEHHKSIADIQRDSDHAMYHAKKEGRNRVSFLDRPCYIEREQSEKGNISEIE
ncbi:MAG TPA: hypothetical protein DCL73_01190 [Treponema sp.]|nr:hypothetical protein [Treponema sp.]